MLDGNPHQLGQRAHAKLGFQLSASIGNCLVAHMQMFDPEDLSLRKVRLKLPLERMA
jgi:hypothetical protein